MKNEVNKLKTKEGGILKCNGKDETLKGFCFLKLLKR